MENNTTTDADLLNGLRKGHPLVYVPTGENVYFRGARFSRHAGEVLATVADEAGGVFAAASSELVYRESI